MITNNLPADESGAGGDEVIRVRKDLPSGTIILNRPGVHNALCRRTIEKLNEALDDFHQERKVRAVILTGSGDSFSSGTDLKQLSDTAKQSEVQRIWRQDVDAFVGLLENLMRFPKPIIAAVNGPALGWGAGLVLASDIVIGGKQASIGFPEPRRGLVANLSAPLLAFRVGAGTAAKILLTGETLDAERAYECGIFHEQVENDLVWARSMEIAAECAKCSPESLQLTKQMLNETIGEQLSTQHHIGAANSATARTTQAASEGVQAFLTKQEPDWQKPQDWSDES